MPADLDVVLDPQDAWLLMAFDWYRASHGYVRRTTDDAYLHRVVMGCLPGDGTYVDHRNHEKLDNRRANLRVGSQAQNMQNCRSHVDARSAIKGVHPTRNGRWAAQFMKNGRRVHVGTFATEAAAASALEVARG